MPLNTLLLSGCLLPGETSFGESGAKVRIQPKSGETVLFFSIDDQSNSNCGFRQILGINQENMKICDLIIFYANDEDKLFQRAVANNPNTPAEIRKLAQN